MSKTMVFSFKNRCKPAVLAGLVAVPRLDAPAAPAYDSEESGLSITLGSEEPNLLEQAFTALVWCQMSII